MVLKKKGKFWYGKTLEDIQTEVRRYSALNGYEAVKFSASTCICGNTTFRLETDEDVGVAKRTCASCGSSHLMGDSADYVADANLEGHECVCDGTEFCTGLSASCPDDSFLTTPCRASAGVCVSGFCT